MIGIGGRLFRPRDIGLVVRDDVPLLSIAKVARLYGGHVALHNDAATVQRRRMSCRIENVAAIGAEVGLVAVDVIANALDVPVTILYSDRIVRLGREERGMAGVRIDIIPHGMNALFAAQPLHTHVAVGVASRLVEWLCLHGAEARLVEKHKRGHADSETPIRIGIQYAFSAETEQRCRAFHRPDATSRHLAIVLLGEIASATGRSHGGTTVENGLSGQGATAVGSICPRNRAGGKKREAQMEPWLHEYEAMALFCGLRRFLDGVSECEKNEVYGEVNLSLDIVFTALI